MKQVYLANVSSRYSSDYTLVFQNRNDAVRTVCACHNCNAEEAASYIKALPYVADPPIKVDMTDVDQVIDIAFKAVEQARGLLDGEQND